MATERETVMPPETNEQMQHIRSDVDWSLRKASAGDALRKGAQDVITAADDMRRRSGGVASKQRFAVADALGQAIERVLEQ